MFFHTFSILVHLVQYTLYCVWGRWETCIQPMNTSTVVLTMNEIIYTTFIQKLTIKWFYCPLFPLSTPILYPLPSLLPSLSSVLSVPSPSSPPYLILSYSCFFPSPLLHLLLSPLPSSPSPAPTIASSSWCRSHSSPDCFRTGSECRHDTAEARCLGRRLRWRVNHVLI